MSKPARMVFSVFLLVASQLLVRAAASPRSDAPPAPSLFHNITHSPFDLHLSQPDLFRLSACLALFVTSFLICFAGIGLSYRKYKYKTTRVFHKKAAAAFVAGYAVPVTLGLVGFMNINITERRQGVVVAAIVAVSLLGKGSVVLQIETWGQFLEILGTSTGHIIATWAAGGGSGHWAGHQGRVPVYAFLVVGLVAEIMNLAWIFWVLSFKAWDLESQRGYENALWWFPQLQTLGDELDDRTHGGEDGQYLHTPGMTAVRALCQSRALCSGVVQPLPVVLFHTLYHWVYIGLTVTAIHDSRGTNRWFLVVAVINMLLIVWFTFHMGGRLLRLLPAWVPRKADRDRQEERKHKEMNRLQVELEDGSMWSVEQWLHDPRTTPERALSWKGATQMARQVLPLRAVEIFEFELERPQRDSEYRWRRVEWRQRVQAALKKYCKEQQMECNSLEGLYEALLSWCHVAERVKSDPGAIETVDTSWRGILRSGLGHFSRLFGEGWAAQLGLLPRRAARSMQLAKMETYEDPWASAQADNPVPLAHEPFERRV